MSKLFLSIGAGPGIGIATAKRFAREGYDILLAARNATRLQAHAADIAALGAKVDIAQVDAADPAAVAALVQRAGAELEVLHYNTGVLHYDDAGALLPRTLDQESVESLISDTQINITSALAAAKAALPAMEAKGTGSLLFTGGGLGVHPSGNLLTLSVGKAGIRAMAQALFEPMKERGIHVATVTVSRLVDPQSVHTDAIAESFWQLHEQPSKQWTVERVYS